MKSILLIGLGRFGKFIAMKLHTMGHQVMACTPTFRLLDKTTATLIVSLLEKYRTIFSAFVPDPEAKIATFFMFSPFFVHKKRKNVQFSAFLAH